MHNVFNIRLITALVVSTILIMSMFVGVRFYLSKLDFERSLNVQIEQTANRITSAVKPSIWSIYSKSIERSFSEEFASGLLDSELTGEYIVGIVVYSQFGHIYMGKAKDTDGARFSYEEKDREKILLQADLIRSYPIRIETMTLGKVELFIDTDIFEKKQQDALIIEMLQIGIVSIFFILVLFYVIKRALLAPMARLQVARKTFESMAEAVVFTDENGFIYDANPAFRNITQLSEEEMLDKNISIFFPEMLEEMKLLAAEEGDYSSWKGETECHHVTNKSLPVWLTISIVRTSNERTTEKDEFVFVFQDISDRKEAEKKLQKLAFFDALTDQPNRQYFESELEASIQLAKRQAQKVGLIYIDLDNFKHINDGIGHIAADEVLRECARRFKSRIRDSDFLSRVGGDEFTVMVRNIVDSQQVAKLASDLIEVVGTPIIINDIEFKVGASLGISIFPDDASNSVELIKNADIAMYHAKESGKDQFSFFTSNLNEKVERYFELKNKIDLAIRNSEFVLYFQPKIDLVNNKVVAAEALIRWITPDGNIIRPDTFIPVAEETKQIIAIGRWVIEEAVNQLAKWKNTKYSHLALSINLSPVQLYDENLMDFLQSALHISAINPEQLEIEITESAVIKDADSAINILNKVKELGIKLSLDDFGTGYSSLSYLQLLPVDILKIDRSFIASAERGNVSAEILTSIIKLAEALSIDVVAEGIEDEQHLLLLKSQNCRLGQGYYFSPPLEIKAFEAFELAPQLVVAK
jgi:diguanylate cyclase (GGDEF)-like protein/PAS domain S-box-containing protein